MSAQQTLTIDEVIRDFGRTGNILPRSSMSWVLDNWTTAAPRFLELLAGYVAGTDRSKPTVSGLFFIIHLLGEKAETAAFGDLCRLLRDRDAAEAVIGDAVTTTLRQILISTFDGDVAGLRSVIEATGADEFVRDAAILTMAYLTRIGRIPEADTHAYLRHLLTAMQPQDSCYIWVGWTECVAVLGFADFAPDVRLLFEREFVEPFTMDYSDFEADLKQTLDDPERMAGLAAKQLSPLTGVIDELAGWYGFSEKFLRDQARYAERRVEAARQEEAARQVQLTSGGGVRNPWRNVGRNDPCPCGSGRKFKKCCLGKIDAEAPIARTSRVA